MATNKADGTDVSVASLKYDGPANRLLQMWNDDAMTDVTFVVQGTEIKGHRSIAGSARGHLRELLENNAERVTIPEDIAPHTFKAVLKFLYTDDCEINMVNLFELLHASVTLGVRELEIRCAKVIESNLEIRNIALYCTHALNFHSEETLKVCREFFTSSSQEVIKTEEFLDISSEALCALSNTDGIWFTLDVFFAYIRWANCECARRRHGATPENLRTVLKDVLRIVTFSDMPKMDFVNFVAPTKILTPEEVGKIIMKPTSQAEKFSTKIIKVLVVGFMYPDGTKLEDTELFVTLSTTVSRIKKMKIFDGGVAQCPMDDFTLEHDKKELRDGMTLLSIYNRRKQTVLKIHSFTFLLRLKDTMELFYFTIKSRDIKKGEDIIKNHLADILGPSLERVGHERMGVWLMKKQCIRHRVRGISWPYYPWDGVDIDLEGEKKKKEKIIKPRWS